MRDGWLARAEREVIGFLPEGSVPRQSVVLALDSLRPYSTGFVIDGLGMSFL